MRHFIFSSTAAVYGNPARVPVTEDDATVPMSPYGSSKLMTEIMLRDAGAAHGLDYVILRYFNVAGADPLAAHRPVDAEARPISSRSRSKPRSGLRAKIAGFRHRLSDARRHLHPRLHPRLRSGRAPIADALAYLRARRRAATLNCGYGHGFSVLEVIETVKRVSGVDFRVDFAPRRPGDPAEIVAASERIRATLGWQPHSTTCRPSSPTRSPGSASCRAERVVRIRCGRAGLLEFLGPLPSTGRRLLYTGMTAPARTSLAAFRRGRSH